MPTLLVITGLYAQTSDLSMGKGVLAIFHDFSNILQFPLFLHQRTIMIIYVFIQHTFLKY